MWKFLSLTFLAGTLAAAQPAAAQQQPAERAPAAERVILKEVARESGFLFGSPLSNASVLIPAEGVLVTDTRQHPRDAQDLIDRIRKVTDKPIKWLINSHFHGDHHFGNPAFKAAGATIVAQ